MVFITGDIHGNPEKIIRFSEKMELTPEDIIIILGDVGCNYYKGKRDKKTKEKLSAIGPTIFCIHGNHEMRPQKINTYKEKEWNGGIVFYEDKYPNLLFAKDGEIFNFNGFNALVIGGAYSVDKEYRLACNYGWWSDEQPSKEIKEYVEEQIKKNKIDLVLSHTCPAKYTPTEAFLGFIDQSKVDRSTEEWLDFVEENTKYIDWFCGHWHIDKNIDRIHFLFDSFMKIK